jgi:large subunit ribosomal protein L3
VMKRWGFKGGPRTHGQSDRERAPGSIGQTTTPGRVFKGKKMAGRSGGKKETIRNLLIVKVDENGEVWIKGQVPGSRGDVVKIRKIQSRKFAGLFDPTVKKADEGKTGKKQKKEKKES